MFCTQGNYAENPVSLAHTQLAGSHMSGCDFVSFASANTETLLVHIRLLYFH